MRVTPLAQRLRPQQIDQLVGLEELIRTSVLQSVLTGNSPPNLLFWGPPGCGKTTLARIIGDTLELDFVHLSAVQVGVKEVRKFLGGDAGAQGGLFAQQQRLIFLDEIHHFNKSQQDTLLRELEEGRIFLIGATTENPSFALNRALLSRLAVVVLPAANEESLLEALRRALDDPRGLNSEYSAQPEVLEQIAHSAAGDFRQAFNLLEQLAGQAKATGTTELSKKLLDELLVSNPLSYDRGGDRHFDMISALIKSLRGSDPDAALFWLAAMYEAGADPLYLARRMLIFASEDVGNADPQALQVALAAHQAFERLGRAEGWIPLAQAATYLATAPKSNAAYSAYKKARTAVTEAGQFEVPWHLRNKPTALLKELAESQQERPYRYPHDEPYGYAAGEPYFPEGLQPAEPWYQPVERGHEKILRERLTFLRRLDKTDDRG